MALRWTDIHAIGEILYDTHTDIDPLSVRFTDLMQWVMDIDDFDDAPERCGERVLEAIQMAWYSEWKEDNT
ncbi:MAG: Fe-S cluster assembly protein IscX [Myxococcota bacterium]|nr:Fe-S cluster assembly protein IscX [Myxococcota bacterium]